MIRWRNVAMLVLGLVAFALGSWQQDRNCAVERAAGWEFVSDCGMSDLTIGAQSAGAVSFCVGGVLLIINLIRGITLGKWQTKR